MIIRQSLGKNFDALTLGKLETTSSLPSKLNFPTHPFKQLDWFPEFSQDLKSRMLSDDALERRRKGEKKKKKRIESEWFGRRKQLGGKERWRCGGVGGDDEWIFRSETPPRSRGPEKHPFSFETRIESNGIPLWFIAAVSRFTFEKQRDIFLSKRVDTTLLGNGVSKRWYRRYFRVRRGGPPPFFRRSFRREELIKFSCELFLD